MPDKKLTDNEIIKALNNCKYGYKSCDECPLCNDPCEIDHGGVPNFIVDLINRLQKDSNRLKKVQMQLDDLCKMHNIIKAEAYKECIEKVKEEINKHSYGVLHKTVINYKLDNLLKKLVGGEE